MTTDPPDDRREDADAARANVVDRYSGLARRARTGETLIDQCGAGEGCFGADQYPAGEGVPEGASRASLGCGNPLAVAGIVPGETVLDLGSGGGLDVILSARRTCPTGKVYGLDASPDMLSLARANAVEAGLGNLEFLHGHIEDIPLPDGHVDVVISNCVINLSPDKAAVLRETYRVLRPGGRIGVTDIIAGETCTDEVVTESPAAVAADALTGDEYRGLLLAAGFTAVAITPTHQAGTDLRSAIIQATKPDAPKGVTIRPMRPADADQVLAIYQAGLDTGGAGFETTAPTWEAFDAARLPLHRHVAVDTTTGRLLGWIAASAVSDRCVYAGVVEHSVYVQTGHRRRGIAEALLRALIGSTETGGIWTIQSGVFPDNTASLGLHHQAGFRDVGTRHHVGRHHGQWRDVVLLERRSPTVGYPVEPPAQ
jgi:L-amino acid N-acyltransferase YncA/2-polyprenyl-3-methyl-5-hydroxy-6-metoxy-1,4-benzoquinol methylase